MSAEQKAKELGIDLSPQEPGYLNLCIRSGIHLITSGHVSDIKGVLGKDLAVEDGYKAARECAEKILRSVHNTHGTLDGLRVVKLLGCVYSDPAFTDQHLVINGASDLLHELYGKDGDARQQRRSRSTSERCSGNFRSGTARCLSRHSLVKRQHWRKPAC